MTVPTGKIMNALLVTGTLLVAASIPAQGADGRVRGAGARRASAQAVTPASYQTLDPSYVTETLDYCPEQSRMRRCMCRMDCRPYICSVWTAHADYVKMRHRQIWCSRGLYYAANPGYIEGRDGAVVSASGYGVPVSVPLAPVTGYTWNYGWGVTAARLTPIGGRGY